MWNALNPRLLCHGHMHVKADGTTTDSRRDVRLNRDMQDGNVTLLDVATFDIELPPMQQLRNR
ncbi:hypothetical protein [Microbacterium sp. B35-30]|uniref:hypothetical protein n=1 Tax=Microbacterium sp. B35-30 TaxID=1962642 RepID=UPI0013D20940|nr:hypothetical protein [Microbacterium sp. B35-30]